MSLLNRLRPKWQNSDPEVRAEAVRQLDKSEVELLLAVAQGDDDPRVRRIAVKKLDAPKPLLEIAETDEDSGLRAFAMERARHLLVAIACDERDADESRRALSLLRDVEDLVAVVERARFDDVRAAAYAALETDEALAELVRRGKDAELRSRALERIRSPQALRSIVVDESSNDLAAAALSRIDDPAILETLLELHTLPKALRRQAFSRLWDIVPDEHPVKAKARRERFEEICASAEALGKRASLVSPEELRALESDWADAEASASPEPDVLERYRAAVGALESLVKRSRRTSESPSETTEIPERSAEEPEARPEPSPGTTPRTTKDAEVEALVELLAGLGEEELESGFVRARAAREELGELDDDSESRLDEAFRDAEGRRERAARSRETGERLEELLSQAERTVDTMELAEAERDWRVIERHYQALGDSPTKEIAERYERLQSKLASRRERLARELKSTHEELERRIAALTDLAAQDPVSIKDAVRELRESQDFLKTMGPLPAEVHRKKARRRLIEAREALFKRTEDTKELEEWKRWANADIQETLIQRIEALRESNDLPKVAKEMRRIHAEWKSAASAPAEKSEELWQRYKSVRDELKGRTDAFFEKQKAERADNLAKKEALCAEVEALQDSESWNETAEAIKELQARWRKIGPVPKEASDAVWKRFRAACDRFFERRKAHFDELKGEREANLEKKEALCVQAESIRESTDWSATAAELKRLQAEWRTIGPVPRKKSDAIWKRFRAACDHFFDRFKRRDEVEIEERAKERAAIVAELEALPGDVSGSDLAERALEIWNRWKKLGAPARKSGAEAEVAARFEAKMGELLASSPELFRRGELDPAQSRKRRARLVERLESIVGELQEGASGEPLEDLAARLKDALARNTMTGGKGRRGPMGQMGQSSKTSWSSARDEVARIRANWSRTVPVGGDEGRALASRFDEAYRSFLELEPESRSRAAQR